MSYRHRITILVTFVLASEIQSDVESLPCGAEAAIMISMNMDHLQKTLDSSPVLCLSCLLIPNNSNSAGVMRNDCPYSVLAAVPAALVYGTSSAAPVVYGTPEATGWT
jgi:hypothetical protein